MWCSIWPCYDVNVINIVLGEGNGGNGDNTVENAINIVLGEGNGGNEDNTVENLLIEAIDNVLGGRSGRFSTKDYNSRSSSPSSGKYKTSNLLEKKTPEQKKTICLQITQISMTTVIIEYLLYINYLIVHSWILQQISVIQICNSWNE